MFFNREIVTIFKKGCIFVTFLLYYNSNEFVTISKGDYIVNKQQFKNLLSIAGKILSKSKLIVFALLVIIGIVSTSLYSGVTLAYSVEYNGEVIGQIKDKTEFDEAVAIANSMVETVDLEQYAHTPEFTITFTTEESLTTLNDVALAIIEETDDITEGNCIYVNGKIVAYISAEFNVEDFIETYLAGYIEGEDIVSSFVAPVECVKGYYHKNVFTSFEDFKVLIGGLDVQSVQTVRTPVSVPFETIKRRDDSLALGVQKTESEGVDGISNNVSKVIMVNGEAVETEYVGQEVITQPVSKVVIIGNRGASIKAAWIEELNCIWPVKRVKGQYVSSYWGDDRNHKGIDIASAYGTPIYAAQSGTVVTAEFSDGYGYYVVIEHNGVYKTLYGHASELAVSKGEKVSQGQLIAYVGSTGMSTGNHLHFEVIRKGNRIDAGPFIGL